MPDFRQEGWGSIPQEAKLFSTIFVLRSLLFSLHSPQFHSLNCGPYIHIVTLVKSNKDFINLQNASCLYESHRGMEVA